MVACAKERLCGACDKTSAAPFAMEMVQCVLQQWCNVLSIHVFESASRGPSVHARLTRAVRCSLSEFSVLVTGFQCFLTVPFLFALVVPVFLRFHLDLGCYLSSVMVNHTNKCRSFITFDKLEP